MHQRPKMAVKSVIMLQKISISTFYSSKVPLCPLKYALFSTLIIIRNVFLSSKSAY